MARLDDFTRALAARDQPQAVFAALDALARDVVGADLFTIMERDPGRGVSWRSYSNRPEVWPLSGEKPIVQNRWAEIVVDRGQSFVANSIAELSDVFPDHALIAAQGLGSCLNLPIVIAGELRGTLNCLAGPGHFTPDRVTAAEALKLPGAAAFMLARQIARGPAGL